MKPYTCSKSPLVTIGVLTHNASHYVDRTIPAILSWLPAAWELIVLDNGSTDSTVAQLRQYPGLRIVCSAANTGCGSGRNALVDMARGDYLLLIDDDILVRDRRVVTACLLFCRGNPHAGFVSVPLIDVGRERTRHYGLFFAERKKERSLAELRSNPWFPIGGFTGGLVFCHKSTFQQLGGFDTIYRLHIDDFDLSARAHLHGWGIYTVTTTYAVHLGVDRKDDVNAWIESQRYHLCGFVRMILKNYRFSGVLLWTPLACLWILWKTIMKSVQTGTPRVLVAYITSVRYLFRDLGDTLEERRRIQSSRTVTQDVFRRVRSPRMKVGIALRP